MAKKKTYKKLTQAEKKVRKEIREEIREKGLIPPIKPKLNRKKFREVVKEEFKDFNNFSDIHYLYEALTWLTADKTKISQEQVGVLKAMKLAMDIKKFMEENQNNGETKYSPMELYKEVVKPILEI